jgi:hypothetical protein
MKNFKQRAARIATSLLALLGILPALASLTACSWEVGVINSWLDNAAGGGPDYGVKLMVRQELWRYVDLGARFGYMHSESLEADYVPLTATAAIKYPLFNGRFVPFFGAQFGYHFYYDTYRSSQELTPNIGFDWRFGDRKQWSIYCEGVYQYGHVHLRSDDSSRPVDGAGGSIGVSCRF